MIIVIVIIIIIIIIIIILRKKTPCGIQITKRCLPQPVACTNLFVIIIIIIIPSKTCVIPRTFKGFWKVYRWRSFVEG